MEKLPTLRLSQWTWGVAFAIFTVGLISAAAAPNFSNPYTFVTIAGASHHPGFGDGTNGGAQLTYPAGIAVGTNGNVYVVDTQGNNIRQLAQVGTNWVVTTVAGSAGNTGSRDGTNSDALFNAPSGIAADKAGNLYVADTANDTIRRIVHTGTNWVVTTIAGNALTGPGYGDGTNGAASFSSPYGIATDSAGNIYVADSDYNIIRQITQAGTNWVVTTIAGYPQQYNTDSIDGTNQNAQFASPYSLTVDAGGNVFVLDGYTAVIRKMTLVGTNWAVTTIAGTENVVGTDDGSNGVIKFSAPLYGLTVDASDNLYVSDSFNYTIRKVSPLGTNWVSTTLAGLPLTAGAQDGTGTNATFGFPWGIAVDSVGNLYVADTSNNDIRKGFIAGLPNLTISLTAPGSVQVLWPGSFGTLQTNGDLSTGNWGVFGGTINSANGTNSTTIPASAGTLFFRLSN